VSLLPLRGIFLMLSTFLSLGAGAPSHTGTQDLSPPWGWDPCSWGASEEGGLPGSAGTCLRPRCSAAACRRAVGAAQERGHGDRLARGRCVLAEPPLNKCPDGTGPGLCVAGSTVAGVPGTGALWGRVGMALRVGGVVGPAGQC